MWSYIIGLMSLKADLSQDIGGESICDLCQLRDGIPVLLCFEAARPLDPFVDHFDIMMENILRSNLFLRFIEKRLKMVVDTRSDLTIADIYTEIWQPVFNDCLKLLESLADQSMILSFVDAHFKDYSDILETMVNHLAVAVSKCSNIKLDPTSLSQPLYNIRQYWKVCEYQKVAQFFLKLKDLLQLNGDFCLVERLSQVFDLVATRLSVYNILNMLFFQLSLTYQALKSVDGSLLQSDAGFFLEEILHDPQKSRCLQCFIDCQGIISWLKDFTES